MLHSLYKHPGGSGKGAGPGVNRAGLSSRDARAGEVISRLSLSFLICTMSCYVSRNEWMSAEFHFWVICCVLDDSWHSSHPALARKRRRPVLWKKLGSGNTKGLRMPKGGCELYFPGGLGQPSRLGARSSCGQREAAGSEGIQTALSHPLPHQPALCKNSKLPIKPPSLFFFHSPAHLPLLFSPFLSKLIINRSRQK